MTNIRSTIESALGGTARSYPRYVDAAVNALQARENGIKNGLSQYARRAGLSQAQVDDLFIEVGLNERPAEPTGPTAGALLDQIQASVNDLNRRLDNLRRG